MWAKGLLLAPARGPCFAASAAPRGGRAPTRLGLARAHLAQCLRSPPLNTQTVFSGLVFRDWWAGVLGQRD